MVLMDVELKHIYKTYPGPKKALIDINLTVSENEKIFITGPSGAGKTTLFKVLAGLIIPSSGQAIFKGKMLNYDSYLNLAAHRRKVGVIFQDFRLLNDRNVYENVVLPAYAEGKKLDKKQVETLLDSLGLIDYKDKSIESLSGGQKQRVTIARTLMQNPDLIIADEPTGNLDFEMSKQVMELFLSINKTLIIATHDQNLIQKYSKRSIIINEGHLSG